LSPKLSKYEYVVLAIPKNNNQKTLICVEYRTKNNKIHPLLSHDSDLVPEPVFLQNIGQDVIVPRGGGNYDLINKKILIAGCGSLGSQIACDLAKTGLGSIDICDFDNFRYENIYRHALGKESIGLNKAVALKSLIEKQIPFINVNAFPTKIEDLISHPNFVNNEYDALILATGFPTTNLFVNQIIKTKFLQLPVIFTWIEPYGIGGHALLSSKSENGCYNCLYDNNLHNKASFAGSDQPRSFAKKIAGCGSLFVPFSYLDATKTSNLAVRLLVSFLTGSEKGNPLLSWKGNSETFEKEGFNLSTRYNEQTEEIMNEKRYNYKNSICQICGKK
jgi:molybdopterin-synthase adenylyltransferase